MFICPECKARMKAKKKKSKGDYVEHRFDCENANCPALVARGLIVSMLTKETIQRTFYRKPGGRRTRGRKNER